MRNIGLEGDERSQTIRDLHKAGSSLLLIRQSFDGCSPSTAHRSAKLPDSGAAASCAMACDPFKAPRHDRTKASCGVLEVIIVGLFRKTGQGLRSSGSSQLS
ncbi:hypothetical protein [Rhizobium dioscoreae]|uniref:hypothetical protein n=1 Tax=Rhizobium dioscoreae TaxID=2653122 RepID=UPI001F2993F2|nr:hypothetical protein [Rhizobium dioscoreae]